VSEVESGGEMSEAFRALKAHAEALERQLREAEAVGLQQARHSELKAEALHAGILDVDGLRLLDPAQSQGESFNAGEVIARLRRDKPWLFGKANSSSNSATPAATPPRKRFAMDMSVEEWRAARSDLLRRR
jgi:hypothetical protein